MSDMKAQFFTYKPIMRLGQGSFGEVTLARVVETGEVVAAKRIFVRSPEKGLPDNVVREIKALQTLHHENIVLLKDVLAKGSSIVLVQEFCLTDISRVVKQAVERLPEALVKGLFQQILRGVQAVHNANIMHRDLKPSNVLITHTGYVKLADFGLARPLNLNTNNPQYTHTVATRWYRAPELLYGARVYGPPVDLWAAGLIFAELIGLAPLLPGENDIDQLGRVISTLGSIEPDWPGVKELPDWGKVMFPPATRTPLSQLLPFPVSHAALELLDKFLRYDPSRRITAAQALADSYFFQDPLPASPQDIAAYIANLHAAV